MKLPRQTGALVAAIALVVIGAVTILIGWPGGKDGSVREFAKEPIISVYVKETGEKKDMPIEEYVMGVVAGEMKPNWPLGAYAAQAIWPAVSPWNLSAEVAPGAVWDRHIYRSERLL